MTNRDIPESEINEAVARARGCRLIAKGGIKWAIDKRAPNGLEFTAYVGYDVLDPLTSHNQFHEIWTPEMEAKACDVLDKWLSGSVHIGGAAQAAIVSWWNSPKYKSGRRLWQLRAYCEVMGNEG